MKIEDFAKLYSETKVEELKKVIESAYKSGFDAGIQSVKDQNRTVAGVEFIDLKLPSGTLWSKSTQEMTFMNAILHNIPTEDQWKELFDFCDLKKDKKYARYNIVGPNGQEINFMDAKEPLNTWFSQDSAIEKYKNAINLQKLNCNSSFVTESVFIGSKLPVFFVINS